MLDPTLFALAGTIQGMSPKTQSDLQMVIRQMGIIKVCSGPLPADGANSLPYPYGTFTKLNREFFLSSSTAFFTVRVGWIGTTIRCNPSIFPHFLHRANTLHLDCFFIVSTFYGSPGLICFTLSSHAGQRNPMGLSSPSPKDRHTQSSGILHASQAAGSSVCGILGMGVSQP